MGYRREDILRDQLLDESDRLGSREWADYKQKLFKVEALLRSVGASEQIVRNVITDVDERAVALYTHGRAELLNLGIETGRKLASGKPFVIDLPGRNICMACQGGAGQRNGPASHGRIDGEAPCSRCEGRGYHETEPLKLFHLREQVEELYPNPATPPANSIWTKMPAA